MTKIATIEVTVPDDVKPDDDVFNYMRSNAARMKIVGFKENPEDPPMVKYILSIGVDYEARGAEDASVIENDINNALQSIKGVTKVNFIGHGKWEKVTAHIKES